MKPVFGVLIVVWFVLTVITTVRLVDRVNEAELMRKNLAALNDSVDVYKKSNGVLIAEKRQISSTLSDLKKLDTELYNELQKYKGKGKVIGGTIIVMKYDTIYRDKPIYIKGRSIDTTINRDYGDSVIMTHISIPLRADMLKDSTIQLSIDSLMVSPDINLQVNVVHTRKNIFSPYQLTNVSTNHQDIKIQNIKSWDGFDKPKPRIIIRPGLTAAVIYDPFGQNLRAGIGVGLVATMIRK